MASILKPDMVTLVVAKSKLEYQVQRGMLCAMSEYVDRAFKEERFLEGKEGRIELPDAQPWVIEVFIGWVYTQTVSWDASAMEMREAAVRNSRVSRSWVEVKRQLRSTANSSQEKRRTSNDQEGDNADMVYQSESLIPKVETEFQGDTPEAQAAVHQLDLTDPTPWMYGYLFKLYVFADMYECRRLRTFVIEIVQIRFFHQKPVEYLYPSDRENCCALESLPSASPLYKLILHTLIHNRNPGKME
jgi:hypothetical protein